METITSSNHITLYLKLISEHVHWVKSDFASKWLY